MDEIISELKDLIRRWLESQKGDVNCLIPVLWEAAGQVTGEIEGTLPALTSITAEQVQLLVTDQVTGRPFYRVIPLEFLETSNGITLSGETYAAQPTQIVFFTEFALGKLLELQGEEGHDSHDHDHHHHD